MARKSNASRPAGGIQLMAGFKPLRSLWDGPGALYPSEQSVRWARRLLGPDLARSEAVARVRGKLVVHPERWVQVAERQALDSFKKIEDSRERGER
jgi:hypothetical protein